MQFRDILFAASAGSVGISFLPEAEAVFAAMSVAPTLSRKILINNCIAAIIDAGVWTKLDQFWMLAAHDAQASRINWKNPAQTISTSGTPVFQTDRGWTGSEVTVSHLSDIHAFGGANPTQYANASAHIGVWNTTDLNVTGADMGATGTGCFIRSRGSGNFTGRVNNGIITVANGNSIGHYIVSRTSTTIVRAYKNGADIGGITATNTSNASTIMQVGGDNQIVRAGRQQACAHYGGGLTAQNSLDIYNAIHTYLIGIGAA